LSEVKKTRGGVYCISLEFGVIVAISLRATVLPVKARSVEITHENNATRPNTGIIDKMKVILSN
jgi:hypothetical protein